MKKKMIFTTRNHNRYADNCKRRRRDTIALNGHEPICALHDNCENKCGDFRKTKEWRNKKRSLTAPSLFIEFCETKTKGKGKFHYVHPLRVHTKMVTILKKASLDRK